MKDVKFRFKVNEVKDNDNFIDVYYSVAWKYGFFPWQYVRQDMLFDIPTGKPEHKDEVNPFYQLKAYDIPNSLLRGLLINEIKDQHIEEGINIIAEKQRKSLSRWSNLVILDDTKEFLPEDRRKAVEHIERAWFGENK